MNSIVLYLVGHGAMVSASEESSICQIDAPLSEEGVDQAWALREWLEPIHFSRVISSDLSRSQRTARIIVGWRTNPVETLPALREIDLGEWEGFSFDEIRERFPEDFAARRRDIENWRPPHGESFADCFARVNSVLDEILAGSRGNVLLVGHTGVNRLILCSVMGIPVSDLLSIDQDYGCVNVIEFGPEHTRVQLMNHKPAPVKQTESAI